MEVYFNNEKMKERRTKLGLTQRDIAKMTGLGTTTIGNIESGGIKSFPRVESYFKILNALKYKNFMDLVIIEK